MDTIKRKLNSVGKECFIRDWNLWGLDTLEAVDLLMKRYSYKETGARTRVHCAKWLLRDRATREYRVSTGTLLIKYTNRNINGK